MTTFHIISLFPESFDSYLGVSIVKRAVERGLIAIKHYNPRDFTSPRHSSTGATAGVPSKKDEPLTYADRRVDSRPYGGGPGMVIEALPVIKAIDRAIGKKTGRGKSLEIRDKEKINSSSKASGVKIIFFSPAGKLFSNEMAESFKKYSDIVFVCGRYEGIDARIKKAFPMVDISVGPYVLTGGELPAMIVIDAVTRRIPGVLGHDSSVEESRISSSDVYTRPEAFTYKKKSYKVPKILLTGHHAKIDAWKNKKGSLRNIK